MHTTMTHTTRTSGRAACVHTRRGHGFTMIEVMFAAGILSLAVAALVWPLAVAAEHQQVAANWATADSLARQAAEKVLLLEYDEVLLLDGTTETGSSITDIEGVAIGHASLADYQIQYEANEEPVALTGETADEALKFAVVSITVSHPDTADIVINRMIPYDD